MDTNKNRYTFDDFREVISVLRSENGCPWDRVQTHESLRKNLIEESYEFIHEADNNSKDGMCEELGDVLLQVMLHSQIAEDNGEFTIDDVIDGIAKKMIFRHPHVFRKDEEEYKISAQNGSDRAYDIFKNQKDKEKKFKNKIEEIEHIPEDFPSLIKGYKMVSKLSKIQPDIWNNSFDDYLKKTNEELSELKEAYQGKDANAMEDELGDVLMTVVSLGKTMEIDSEVALSKAFKKVLGRLKCIEENCEKNGEKIEEISRETFSKYWQDAKNIEK